MEKSVDLVKGPTRITPSVLITGDADTSKPLSILHVNNNPEPKHIFTYNQFHKALQDICYLPPFKGNTYRYLYVHEPEWWYTKLMANTYFLMTRQGQILSRLV